MYILRLQLLSLNYGTVRKSNKRKTSPQNWIFMRNSLHVNLKLVPTKTVFFFLFSTVTEILGKTNEIHLKFCAN